MNPFNLTHKLLKFHQPVSVTHSIESKLYKAVEKLKQHFLHMEDYLELEQLVVGIRSCQD